MPVRNPSSTTGTNPVPLNEYAAKIAQRNTYFDKLSEELRQEDEADKAVSRQVRKKREREKRNRAVVADMPQDLDSDNSHEDTDIHSTTIDEVTSDNRDLHARITRRRKKQRKQNIPEEMVTAELPKQKDNINTSDLESAALELLRRGRFSSI